MILPGTLSITVFLILAGLICLGSWANLYKAGQGIRFELFYFDFAIGAAVMALVLGLTFGNLGFDGFTFVDDLLHAGRRQEFFTLFGGVALNLATMLMLAAISMSGISFAFPATVGTATVIAVLISYYVNRQGNPLVIFPGIALLAGAVILNVSAYRLYAEQRELERIGAGRTKGLLRSGGSTKAITLSLVAGLLMGLSYPIIQLGSFREGESENGLGPYALGFIVAAGVVASAFVFNLFFMNVPIDGEPLDLFAYFHVTARKHLLGFLAGAIWYSGLLAGWVALLGQASGKIAPQIVFGVLQGSVVVATLWGLTKWREYWHGNARARMMVWVGVALFAIGLTLITLGPLMGINRPALG